MSCRSVTPLLVLVVNLAGFSCANASAWNLHAGDGLAITRLDYFVAELPPVNTVEGIFPSEFRRLETNTYGEFGITDQIMVGGKLRYGSTWLSRGATTDIASGFSEAQGFVQYQIFRRGKHAGAVKIAATRPSRFMSGARPILQSDKLDLGIFGVYGRNLFSEETKVFLNTEFGFEKRLGAAADQIKADLTVGAELSSKWLLLVDAFTTVSLQNEELGGADFDVYKIRPSIVWRMGKRLHFQSGVTWEVAGRNIDLGRTIFLGIWTNF